MAKTLDEYLALPYRLEITPDLTDGYVVSYPDLPGCFTHVEQWEDITPVAHEILAGWLELALEDGTSIPEPRRSEEYSGKFILRMPKSLHRTLAETAEREGVSLNQYAVTVLAGGQGHAPLQVRLDELCEKLDALQERLSSETWRHDGQSGRADVPAARRR